MLKGNYAKASFDILEMTQKWAMQVYENNAPINWDSQSHQGVKLRLTAIASVATCIYVRDNIVSTQDEGISGRMNKTSLQKIIFNAYSSELKSFRKLKPVDKTRLKNEILKLEKSWKNNGSKKDVPKQRI